MVLENQKQPLRLLEIATPRPAAWQVLIRVHACAVCRTDLHVVDGELPHPKLPLVPGHEVVGVIAERGPGSERFAIGQRVGVPWLAWTCGQCRYCKSGRENLCEGAIFNGYTTDGGYAEYLTADQRFCFPIPEVYSDAGAAPLLCAGLIGYRCLRKAGDAKRLGIYGFGAAAHIVAQVAIWEGREIYAFTRDGDAAGQDFALALGAAWAGGSGQIPPKPLDAAIIFAPVGDLVPLALHAVAPGGAVVCGGIHSSAIPSFSYDLLWGERMLCSVVNLTRRDGDEFFALAPRVPVRATVETFPLVEANEVLARLRTGKIRGAAVLEVLPANA